MTIPMVENTQKLLEKFIDLCLRQDKTYISGNTILYNKLFKQKRDIVAELASRPGDERRALLPLLHYDNPHVRLQAAKSAYPVSPGECRSCIEAIAAAKLPNQSLDAGMTLYFLDQDPHCLDGPPPHYKDESTH
jgi:Domain of unknown function (DUF2019)